MTYNKYECLDLQQTQHVTSALSKAVIVPFKFEFGGVQKDCKELFGIYNYTQDSMATSCSKDYHLLQHTDYFNNFALALNNLNMKHKMLIFEQGHKAYADIEFIDQNLKFTKIGEEFITGIRLTNSYDKKTGITIIPKFTRLACMNGMVMNSYAEGINLRHNNKLVDEINIFIETRLNLLINKYAILQQYVSDSMNDSIEWLTACKIMAQLVKSKTHREEVFKRLGISYIVETDKEGKIKNIAFVFNDQNNIKEKFTRWELYNAITNYCSHNGQQLSPMMEDALQNKAEKLFMNKLSTMPVLEIMSYKFGSKKNV